MSFPTYTDSGTASWWHPVTSQSSGGAATSSGIAGDTDLALESHDRAFAEDAVRADAEPLVDAERDAKVGQVNLAHVPSRRRLEAALLRKVQHNGRAGADGRSADLAGCSVHPRGQ